MKIIKFAIWILHFASKSFACPQHIVMKVVYNSFVSVQRRSCVIQLVSLTPNEFVYYAFYVSKTGKTFLKFIVNKETGSTKQNTFLNSWGLVL